MFRVLYIIAATLLFFCTNSCSDSGKEPIQTELKVMTFNVLCSFCNNDYDPWEERLAYFEDILDRHLPDIVGLQELTWPEEVDQFLALRQEFKAIYFIGDEAGPIGFTDYPDATILYRADRFKPQTSGSYWLSPTPDQSWTTGFSEGFQLPRIVVWAVFEEMSSGLKFFFSNTHFDNNSPSQELSAPLLLERSAPWAEQMPIIVTGDFNSRPIDPAYLSLVEGEVGGDLRLVNLFDIADNWTLDTNLEPVPNYDLDSRIDHIFVAGADTSWECPQWVVDLHVYGANSSYPSDHFAISAHLKLTTDSK